MKILIFTKNWVGDMLFQMPAIDAIAARWPAAEIVCLVPARCREMLRAHPRVNRVIVFDERNEHRSWGKRLALVWELRKEKWDQAYLFHRSKTRALIALLAGARKRTGYASGRRWLLTDPIPEPGQPLHHVDYFLNLIEKSGVEVSPEGRNYRFYFSPEDDQSARELLISNEIKPGRYVCFHLGANWEPKRWPPSHFAKLADLFSTDSGLVIVLTGAPEDKPLAESVLRGVTKARVLSLIGKTRLGVLGALFQHSAFVVSGDSGPLHIAAGAGARVVALFGPTDPALTGPRGPSEHIVLSYVPPGYHTPWYGKNLPEHWLSNISPQAVFEAVKTGLWKRGLEIPKPTPKKSVRILLVTLTNIGDVIINTPVIMALRKQFPEAEITAVTSPKGEGVLKGSRFLERIVIYDKREDLFRKFLFLRELRRAKYDFVVDLKNTAIPFLIRSKKRSSLIRPAKELTLRDKHLDVLRRMGLGTTSSEAFDFFNSEEERQVLERLRASSISSVKDWIVIAPVAASQLKTWPLEKVKKLVEKLLEVQSEPLFLVGGEREKALIEPLTAVNPQRIFNLAGKTSLRELSVLLSRAALVVAHDSSVLHMAYEMDRPAVGIFGPTNHEESGRVGPHFRIARAGSPCSPCSKPSCRFERQHCFEDLDAEKVFAACQELLHVPAR